MTGVEYIKNKFSIKDNEIENKMKKMCPGDYGITTVESEKCNSAGFQIHYGACLRCWNSEMI